MARRTSCGRRGGEGVPLTLLTFGMYGEVLPNQNGAPVRLVVHAHDLYVLPVTFHVTPKTQVPVAYRNGECFPESEVAPWVKRLKDGQLRSGSETVAVDHLRR